MSDRKKQLHDAFAKEREPKADNLESKDGARAEAIAFIEQTVIPGFEAAADEINEDATRRAEVTSKLDGNEALVAKISVMRLPPGSTQRERSEFVYAILADLRHPSIMWTFELAPTIKGGKLSSSSQRGEMEWMPSMAETTPQTIADLVLAKLTQVVNAQNRLRRQ